MPISSSLSPHSSALTIPRKTLFLLIATLNAVFPDYDFSDIPSEAISYASFQHLTRTVGATLLAHPGLQNLKEIWDVMDDVISFTDCEIFSYARDDGEDESPSIWKFDFLIYNKAKKRVLYFGCRCVRYYS